MNLCNNNKTQQWVLRANLTHNDEFEWVTFSLATSLSSNINTKQWDCETCNNYFSSANLKLATMGLSSNIAIQQRAWVSKLTHNT